MSFIIKYHSKKIILIPEFIYLIHHKNKESIDHLKGCIFNSQEKVLKCDLAELYHFKISVYKCINYYISWYYIRNQWKFRLQSIQYICFLLNIEKDNMINFLNRMIDNLSIIEWSIIKLVLYLLNPNYFINYYSNIFLNYFSLRFIYKIIRLLNVWRNRFIKRKILIIETKNLYFYQYLIKPIYVINLYDKKKINISTIKEILF